MVNDIQKALLCLSILFLAVLNSYAVSPKEEDSKEDSLLKVRWDSLNTLKAKLTNERNTLISFNKTIKGKISKLSNAKVEAQEGLASLNKDSVAILLLQDSLTDLRKQLNSYTSYIKYAERCAIKYANNKLYYPYDSSVETAWNVLSKVKNNPYPQLLDILLSYHSYYSDFIATLDRVQHDKGARAVSAKTSIRSDMMAKIRNDFAKDYISAVSHTSYCLSPYYKTSNSIHYMDVLTREVYNAIAKYKAGQRDLIFSDYIEFGRLFSIDR